MPQSRKSAPTADAVPDTPEETVEAAAVEEVQEGPLAGWELPAAGDLVAIDKDDAYRAMDRADEALILAEIEGRALDVMLYSFNQGGTEVTDLSYAGVRECVRTLNQRGLTSIRIASSPAPEIHEIVEDGEPYYRVSVYAEDTRNGSGQWGVAVEPKRMKLSAGKAKRHREAGREIDADGRVWDKFALTKAVNKAQRNAMKALVPLELQQTLIALLKKQPDRVQRIHQGAIPEKLAELPPPIGPDSPEYEEAEKLRAAARDLLMEIREHHPTAYMTPGQFNALLTRHEWSIERLHEFLQQLQQLRDRAKQEQAAEAAK